MKIRNLLVAILAMSGTVVFAQEQRQIKEEGKTVFKPHWFIQAQVGAAHTVGEAKFTDLMSPAAAINIGISLPLHSEHVSVVVDGRQRVDG